MDIFSDNEPDLMGLELVREFDSLAKKFYSDYDDDLNVWSDSSEIYVDIRRAVIREEVDFVIECSYPSFRPTKLNTSERKTISVPVSSRRDIDNIKSGIEKVEYDSSEDLVATDENIKIVLCVPINNKKENIKVVANHDCSITISHLNYEGRRRTRTLDIPYNIDFETAKATYKNGILEITFDRQ